VSSGIVTATRHIDGALLPAAGLWSIDPGHAELAFIGRHFMVTKVRGRFTDIRGAVTIEEEMSDSAVDVVIGMASVESGNPLRDEHLRSAEMFDVERFPEATFHSSNVDWHGTTGTVAGDLTIRGITRQVVLEVSFEGHVHDPWGGERAIFSATTRLDREDFGINWNVALETGGVLVSKDIKIEIEIETVLQATEQTS
jgi:polyisoprenoid-binding protein YceI